jgi:hypothetical protein
LLELSPRRRPISSCRDASVKAAFVDEALPQRSHPAFRKRSTMRSIQAGCRSQEKQLRIVSFIFMLSRLGWHPRTSFRSWR